jgi:hypothetical protein
MYLKFEDGNGPGRPLGHWLKLLDDGEWAIWVSLNSEMGQWSLTLLTHRRVWWIGPCGAPHTKILLVVVDPEVVFGLGL